MLIYRSNGLGVWPFDAPTRSFVTTARANVNQVSFPAQSSGGMFDQPQPTPPTVKTMPTDAAVDNTVELPVDDPWYKRPIVLVGLAIAGVVGYTLYKRA